MNHVGQINRSSYPCRCRCILKRDECNRTRNNDNCNKQQYLDHTDMDSIRSFPCGCSNDGICCMEGCIAQSENRCKITRTPGTPESARKIQEEVKEYFFLSAILAIIVLVGIVVYMGVVYV